MRTKTDDEVGFVVEDDIGFEAEPEPASFGNLRQAEDAAVAVEPTPSLQPVMGVGEPALQPVPVQPGPGEDSVDFQLAQRPTDRITPVRIMGGADESLLDFIPQIPALSEEQAQVIGSVPLFGGASIGPTGARMAAGAGNAAIGLAKGATTPLALATLGPSAVAGLGKVITGSTRALPATAAARAVGPYFAAEMGAGAVRAVPRTIEALEAGNIQQATEEGLGGIGAALFAHQIVRHQTPMDRIIAEVDASPTPITAATVAGMREAQIAGGPKPGMRRIFDTAAPEATPMMEVAKIPERVEPPPAEVVESPPTAAVAPAPEVAKEPWQMTADEFVNRYKNVEEELVPSSAKENKFNERKSLANRVSVEEYSKSQELTSHLPEAESVPVRNFRESIAPTDPKSSKYLDLVKWLDDNGHLNDVSVTVLDTLTDKFTGKRVAGVFDAPGNSIYLGRSALETEPRALRYLAHESMHAALYRKLRAIEGNSPESRAYRAQDLEIYSRLKSLMDQAGKEAQNRGEKHYGLSNIHEFVSEASTRPSFQKFLESIKVEGGNAWSKFVELVKSLFQFSGEKSVLSETLRATGDLLESPVPTEGGFGMPRTTTAAERIASRYATTIESEHGVLRGAAAEAPEEFLRQRHRFHVEQALKGGKAVPKEVMAGYPELTTAGTPAAEVAQTPEAIFTERIKELPVKSPTMEAVRESIEEQQKMGIRSTPAPVVRGTPILDIIKGVRDDVAGIRKFTPFREALNKWQGTIQDSGMKVMELVKTMESRVPSEKKRNAITNWIQADGDATVLTDRAKTTKDRKLQQGYIDALHLTPDELKFADEVRTLYENKAKELQDAGILSNVVDNYVTQIWKRESIPTAARFAGKLARNFKFNRARTFQTFHEGEQAGFKPATKDISKLVAVYTAEADKVIATRKMIEDLTTKTADDGRPLAVPSGIVKLSAESEPGTRLVLPNMVGKDFSDYKDVNHPALAKWKWGETDPATGVNTMVLGNLKIHPDAFKFVKRALDRPWLRKWYDEPAGPVGTIMKGGVRALDRAGGEMKRTMLGFFSPFHIVQEGTHAVGHRVNPFAGLPEMKAGDPKIQDAMNHGLMLAGEHTGAEQFKEGITGPGLIKKIPWIGKWAEEFSDWTFKAYIPKLKYATYEKMVARNTKVFADELKSGEVTPADVKALSAEQSNAAYGHLNYADLGRDPNLQHFLRTIFLAPDFLEARGRFTGQAAKGLVSKVGREQLVAMATLAATFWITARIGNKLSDDDWHFERPFELKVGNRWLSMRNVPEDIFKLFQDWQKFAQSRLSPLFGQTAMQLITKRNYRGEKITTPEILEEMMTRWIPISIRNVPGVRDLTESTRQNPVSPWESFLGTAGLHVSRYSPITETYKLASEWNDKQGFKPDRGTYPVSKYQQLRYALEDSDMDKAADEIAKLRQEGMSKDKLKSGFKASVLHPFTQSRATDEQFRQSLDGKDRLIYEEAVKSRQALLRKLDSLVR